MALRLGHEACGDSVNVTVQKEREHVKRILFVHGRAGTPLQYALPRVAARAELHVLAISPLPTGGAEAWRPACASIVEAWQDRPRGEDLVELIMRHAKHVGADAVLCLSEYLVLAGAVAAERLGLRGPGSGAARRARDKRLMRASWRRDGVPIPRFLPVEDEADVRWAVRELTPPLLLKPAWGSGSIGQMVVRSEADAPAAFAALTASLRRNDDFGLVEWYEPDAARNLLVEEIISGTTEGWYGDEDARRRYGDYVSIEGIVSDGTYHPLCVTARMPTIPPFTELSSNAPCVLPEPLQRRIEEVARAAVDALGLENCGTHTEIKLCADGSLAVVETAARFGGSVIARVVEHVFGLDMVDMLVRQLLGEPVDYPERMLTRGRGAAATLAWLPADASGRPWTSEPVWRPEATQLEALLSPGSTIETVPELTAPAGSTVPRYDPAAGARNCFGRFFVTAVDPETLITDLYAVTNGLERALGTVPGDR
ncbi:ATP-grasp domain-containing protein [Micromonospora sp. WMMD734]|uniref:ATP-grasp domain-containing protein n=1 Tax=Micromonospora sp. WMMD734 TaxID=3404129 RepID=UPI003B9573C0